MRALRAFSALAILAAVPLLTSCSGGSGGSNGGNVIVPPPDVNTITVNDPIGDTNPGATGTIYDITQAAASRPNTGAVTQIVSFTFVQPVSLPAPGTAAGTADLAGYVYFNTGSTPGVTTTPFCATGGGPATGYTHINFVVQLFTRLADGNYPVFPLGPGGPTTGEATPSVFGNVFVLSIPISAIGGTTGTTKMAAAFGNFANATDCVPNTPGEIPI